jgi:hypothetical protein
VFGTDDVKPRMMLGSCDILVMASDLQSARNVSTVRRQGWRLISNDRCEDVGSRDERDGVKAAPLDIERVEPVEPGMSAD